MKSKRQRVAEARRSTALKLRAKGWSNPQIARILKVTTATVANYISDSKEEKKPKLADTFKMKKIAVDIEKLADAGLTREQIELALNISETTVRKVFNSLGIHSNWEGKTKEEREKIKEEVLRIGGERAKYEDDTKKGKFDHLYKPKKLTTKEKEQIRLAIRAFNLTLTRQARITPTSAMFVEIAMTHLYDLFDFIPAPPFSRQAAHYNWLKYKTEAARFTMAHTFPQLEQVGVDSGWVARLLNRLGLQFDPGSHDLKSNLIKKYNSMKTHEIQGLASRFKI